MARTKKHRNARNQQLTKNRRRKPDIPELVYKFLIANGVVRDAAGQSGFTTKCHCCGGEGRRMAEEVVDSADSPRTAGDGTGYGGRRSHTGRVTKPMPRDVKGRPIDLPISYLQNCVGSEGTRKARSYIKKALDFGIEAGYLIPSDSAYKVLHVSSDLMKSDSRRSRIDASDKAISQEQDNTSDTPARLGDLQVQEQRRRRRRRRSRRGRGRGRSRSDSRGRRRGRRRRRRRRGRGRGRRRGGRSRTAGRTRYGSPQNPVEEVAENNEANDYEMEEDEPKSDIHPDDVGKEPKTARSNSADEEQPAKKAEESVSELSVDEDETDDEEEKKNNETKS